MMIYICTPIVSRARGEADVRKRIDDLKSRLAERGYESCSHLDVKVNGKWADKVGGNLALLLGADGVLLDFNRKGCRVCKIEEAVAKEIASFRTFIIFRTREEFEYVNDKFII